MSQRSNRIARTVALIVFAVSGAAVMLAASTAAVPEVDGLLAVQAALPATQSADIECSADLNQDLFEPAAILQDDAGVLGRRGVRLPVREGLGRCARSKCPVRVCRCR